MERQYWINLEEIIKAGVCFGHGTRKWNPKMIPYIFAKSKDIHILNITITIHFLSESYNLIFNAASMGKEFLIVGTKKKVSYLISLAAIKARCHYVNKKWFGGILTNWSTTEQKLNKLRNLIIEQKMGKFNIFPKVYTVILKRELYILQKYLGGIKYMAKLPDIVIIVNQQEEYKVLQECEILSISTICLIGTNCNPDIADIFIPYNNDTKVSIKFFLTKLVSAICEGRYNYIKNKKVLN